jgi:hypothetical protein
MLDMIPLVAEVTEFLPCFMFQPCLAACIDQTHKLLVTQASYPNEDSFVGTTNFCLLLRKLVRSCNGDRRQVLDIKNPDLCPAIEAEPKAASNLDCFNTNTTEQVSLPLQKFE